MTFGDFWGVWLAWPGLACRARLGWPGLAWVGLAGVQKEGGAGNAKSSNLKRKFNKEIASRMQGDNFGFFGIWLGWAGLDWPARLAWPGLVRLQDLHCHGPKVRFTTQGPGLRPGCTLRNHFPPSVEAPKIKIAMACHDWPWSALELPADPQHVVNLICWNYLIWLAPTLCSLGGWGDGGGA